MRTSLLPGLLNLVSYNLNRGTTDVRLFEAGDVFEKAGDRLDERRHLGFIATGNAQPATLHTAAQPYAFFHMKGDIEELLAAFQHTSRWSSSPTRRRRIYIPDARRARCWTARR